MRQDDSNSGMGGVSAVDSDYTTRGSQQFTSTGASVHCSDDDDVRSQQSFQELLLAADTSGRAASVQISNPHAPAPVPTAVVDLDLLLLARDSIDAYDHEQPLQAPRCDDHADDALSTATTMFSPLPLARGSSVSRQEVTAVQAFLDEWRDDDDAAGSFDTAGKVALVTVSTTDPSARAGSRRGQQQRSRESRATAPPQQQQGSDKRNALPRAPHTTVTSTPSVARKPTTKPKALGTREREKEETVQLRKQALQLSQQLEQLRACMQRATSTDNAPPLWQRVAERQRERVALARMANQRLRVAVREQKQMAKSLHRVLLNRVAHVATMQPRLHAVMPWHAVGESPDDQCVFEQLLAAASAMYAQTDRVKRALALKTPAHGAFRTLAAKHGAMGPYLELIDVGELPFSVAQVNNLLHTFANHITTSRVHKGDTNGSVQATVLMGKEEFRGPGRPTAPRMRYVNLNVVESDATAVFVYCSMLDTVSIETGAALPGRILHERKWIILQDRAPEAAASSQPTPSGSAAAFSATTGTTDTFGAPNAAAGPHKTAMMTFSTIEPMTNHPLAQCETWTHDTIERLEIPMWDRGYTMLAHKMTTDLLELASAT